MLVVGSMAIRDAWSAREIAIVAAVSAVGMAVTNLGRFITAFSGVPSAIVTQFLAVVVALAAVRLLAYQRLIARALAAVAIGIVAFASIQIAYSEPIPIDVYLLHEAAADALANGDNPYTTGSVEVFESHPFEDPEWIREYTYPPLTMVSYAGSSILFGDSRMIGALAIIAAFGLSLWTVGRRWPVVPDGGHIEASVVALLCVSPMIYLIVFPGWTEAIALPFIVMAAAWWDERPVAAAVMLGLAFATKQYFLIAVPLLFFLPDGFRWRRIAWVGGTAFATFIPFLIWDAKGLIDGVVVHHLTRNPRPDAATLAGMGVHVPTAVGVGAAVLVGVLIARQVRSPGQALLAIASTIGVFTILSVRGFRNSWWFVLAVASVALGFAGTEREVSSKVDPSKSIEASP